MYSCYHKKSHKAQPKIKADWSANNFEQFFRGGCQNLQYNMSPSKNLYIKSCCGLLRQPALLEAAIVILGPVVPLVEVVALCAQKNPQIRVPEKYLTKKTFWEIFHIFRGNWKRSIYKRTCEGWPCGGSEAISHRLCSAKTGMCFGPSCYSPWSIRVHLVAILKTRPRPSLERLRHQVGLRLEFADEAPHFPAQNTCKISIDSNFTSDCSSAISSFTLNASVCTWKEHVA